MQGHLFRFFKKVANPGLALFILLFFNTHIYYKKIKNKTDKNALSWIWTDDPWSGKQWWGPLYHATLPTGVRIFARLCNSRVLHSYLLFPKISVVWSSRELSVFWQFFVHTSIQPGFSTILQIRVNNKDYYFSIGLQDHWWELWNWPYPYFWPVALLFSSQWLLTVWCAI